ncbi:hypothetical protein RHODO2019_12745 [Rhodococcus antarcticus]|uniref:DUF1772 domain-containing protein n=1 Tax=Rhodococcus antarcticus TaxID=2987751 RepID=A0ABY6NXC1_9NOCA|nr:hypothetical protein [Rhodococcus antarcticus]UZJ24044.1 hypothetical protein RHODO2019_12745 [Rhodococcus antarcticus]
MIQALVAAAAGWWLAGLGWTVQATAYPGFADVPADRWAAHHAAHSRRIVWAVGPAWVVQGGATAWWLLTSFGVLSVVHAVAALGGVLLTVAWAVPVHSRLGDGFTADLGAALLRANAWRSVVFTAAAVLASAGAA